MAFEVGFDLATVLVAAVAAGFWIVYRRKVENEARERENANERRAAEIHSSALEAQQHANEDRLNHDRAEAADLHNQLTSPEAATARAGAVTPVDAIYLSGLHERVSARFNGLQEEIQRGGEADSDPVIVALLDHVGNRLSDINTCLHPDSAPTSSREESRTAATRDFSKYIWESGVKREGKYAIIALIGAKFARDHGITSLSQFSEKFGIEVANAIGVTPGTIDPDLLVDQVNHEGQRERYAQRDQRWIAEYGDTGLLKLDGDTYRTAWDLGMKSGQPAQRQLALIQYFMAKGYPITPA